MRYKDETGNRYGRLTVLHRVKNEKEPGRALWHCRCDCGKEVDVLGVSLRYGATKSCGCYQKDRSSEVNTVDIKGQKFGRLTVLRRMKSKSNSARWLCRCECGEYAIVMGRNLRSGHTRSCGCLNLIKDIAAYLARVPEIIKKKKAERQEEWRKRLTRWYSWGGFCPAGSSP